MKWLVDLTTTMRRVRGIDAEIGEQLEPQRLRAVGDEHHLDAADAHGGAVAERHLRRPEALPAVARQLRSPSPSHPPACPRQGRSCRRSGAGTSRPRRHRSTAGPRSDPRSARWQAPSTLRSIRWRRMLVLSDGAPPPALSAGSAITTGGRLLATAARHPARHIEELRHRLAAHRHQLLAEAAWPAASALALVAVGDHQHARADLRHVGIGKAVRDRDRQDAVLALHRLDAIDEARASAAASSDSSGSAGSRRPT